MFSVYRPGCEDVGDSAFVHEDRHLRIANRELAAILNLAILHGIAVGKDAVLGFDPLDDINELFGEEIAKAHLERSVNRIQLHCSGEGILGPQLSSVNMFRYR